VPTTSQPPTPGRITERSRQSCPPPHWHVVAHARHHLISDHGSVTLAAPCGLRFAPCAPVRWRSRPRRSLRFTLRPPPVRPSSQDNHPTPADQQPPRRSTASSRPPARQPPPATQSTARPAVATRADANHQVADKRTSLTCNVRTFFTGIEESPDVTEQCACQRQSGETRGTVPQKVDRHPQGR